MNKENLEEKELKYKDEKFNILEKIGDIVKTHLKPDTEEQFHMYHDWIEIVFAFPALCGLDNIDVYNALKDTKIELKKITGKTIEEIKEKISLDYDLHCCIIGVELPKGMDHNDVRSIGEAVCEKLNSDANIIWQGINKDVDEISVYLMMGLKDE